MYSVRDYSRLVDTRQVTGDYAFGAGGDLLVDAEDEASSSWPRFINHSRRRPNLVACVAYWWFGPLGIVYFCATRDIQAGDELFFDYGDEYWDVRVKSTDLLSRLKIDLA
jgi:SET domain-containing protein